jgi:hypothetical protein
MSDTPAAGAAPASNTINVTLPNAETLGPLWLALMKNEAISKVSDCGAAARAFEIERVEHLIAMLIQHKELLSVQHPHIRAQTIGARTGIAIGIREMEALQPQASDNFAKVLHAQRKKRIAALMHPGASLSASAPAPVFNLPPIRVDSPVTVQPADIHVMPAPAQARPIRIEATKEGDRTVMRPVYDAPSREEPTL